MGFDSLLTKDQADAVKILIKPRNHILAMGTGLGKTYAVLAAFQGVRILHGDQYILLVVGPKNSLQVWESEIENRTDFSYVVCRTEDDHTKLTNQDIPNVVITEFTCLPKITEFIQKVFNSGTVILAVDEIHKIKNPKSTLSEMSSILKSNSKYVWGTTATPALNHMEDTYHIVDFVFPGALGSLKNFMIRYTETKQRIIGGRKIYEVVGFKNLDELHKKLEPFMFIRYTNMDVRFHEVVIEQTEQEENLYLTAAAGELGYSTRDFVGRLPDLQLVVDNAVLLERKPNQDYDYISKKEEALLDLVSKFNKEGKAMIIYSGYRKSLYRIKGLLDIKFRRLRKFVITGNTVSKLRKQIESQFDTGDILLITGAGGESLNLQISNVVIMYNLPFKVHEFIQVVGRVARMDSEHPYMDVFIIEAKDTIDTYKKLYILSNSQRIKEMISPNPNLPRVDYVPSRKFIINLRSRLLWRIRKKASVLGVAAQKLFTQKEEVNSASVLSGRGLTLNLNILET